MTTERISQYRREKGSQYSGMKIEYKENTIEITRYGITTVTERSK